MHVGSQILIRVKMLRWAITQVVDILHIAVIHQVTYIVEEILMSLGCHTEDRMIFTIIGLDIAKETIIVTTEILVFRCQSSREVICTQIYNGHSRMEIRLSSIPTSQLGRILVEGLEIAIRHPPSLELRIIVACDTHTRVRDRHVVCIEIARYDSGIGARCVFCLWREALFAAWSIHTITTGIAIADKLQLAHLQ